MKKLIAVTLVLSVIFTALVLPVSADDTPVSEFYGIAYFAPDTEIASVINENINTSSKETCILQQGLVSMLMD